MGEGIGGGEKGREGCKRSNKGSPLPMCPHYIHTSGLH